MRAEPRGACKNPGDRFSKELHVDLRAAFGVRPELEVGDHLFGSSTVLFYLFDVLRPDHIGVGASGFLPVGRETRRAGDKERVVGHWHSLSDVLSTAHVSGVRMRACL